MTPAAADRELISGVVLAAGLGTRLRPLTDALPKPLVPLFGRSLLDRALDAMAAAGVARVAVNACWRADRVAEAVAARAGAPPSVVVSTEVAPLGTAGGARRALAQLDGGGEETFLLVNGDVYFPAEALSGLRRSSHPAQDVVMLVVPAARLPARLHKVEVDAEGAVVGLDGVHAPGRGEAARWGGYACALRAPAGLLAGVDSGEGADATCLKVDALWPWLRRGGRVWAHWLDGPWWDLGTPADYLAAHEALMRGADAELTRLLPWPVRRLGPGVWAAEGARVAPDSVLSPPVVLGPDARVLAGAEVGPTVVLGAGAVVESRARVARCVLWDGARLAADATGEVITRQGRVGPLGVHE